MILLLLLPVISFAAGINLNLDYPSFEICNRAGECTTYDMEQIAASPNALNQLVAWLYYFIVMISGFAAFLMLVWGGFQWMTSAGNPAKIGEAKDRLISAVLGLVLILASWLILNTINPELTLLKMPELQETEQQE